MPDLDLQTGREKDFRVLMGEMVSPTQDNEPGTLNHEWSTCAGSN
jgi:hypothetical protein